MTAISKKGKLLFQSLYNQEASPKEAPLASLITWLLRSAPPRWIKQERELPRNETCQYQKWKQKIWIQLANY
jgi:hypothetical protein